MSRLLHPARHDISSLCATAHYTLLSHVKIQPIPFAKDMSVPLTYFKCPHQSRLPGVAHVHPPQNPKDARSEPQDPDPHRLFP
jgi:hypothetical protein